MQGLRQIREQAGYSQPELAERSGVGQGAISDIERGKRKPQGRTLRKLAGALSVEVADLLGTDFSRAESNSSPKPSDGDERWPPTFREWLQDQSALRILMTDAEVIENFERLASGSDRQAIPNRFEQETRKTFEEESSVEDALRKEWQQGGDLLARPEEGPGVVQKAFARHKEYSRLRREVMRSYSRYYRALEAFSRSLYHEGRATDYVILNKRPQTVEAIREAERALQEEAHHGARGA